MTERTTRVYWIALFSVLLFAWAVAPAWDSFVTADDFLLVSVSVPYTGTDALRYLWTDWGGSESGGTYYRPLVNLSLWANRVVTGLSPAALRATGLLLHVAVSVIVAVIALRRLAFSATAASLSGALFLLLPLHDQAILWIAARTDVLCAMFYGLGFLGLTGRSLRSQLAGSVGLAAALGAKEMAITLPIVTTLWWLILSPHERRAPLLRPVLLSGVVIVAYALVRLEALGGIGGDPGLFVFGRGVFTGLAKMFAWSLLPFDLEAVRDVARIHTVLVVPLYAVALVVTMAVVIRLRRDRIAWFALLWVALTASLVIARPNTWYAYIPSIGGTFFIVALLRTSRYQLGLSIVVVLMAAMSLRGGALQMAEAGRLSQTLVHSANQTGRDLYVANSPSVLSGRYLIVTDQSHFDSAARNLGLRFRTIALNYAYIERPNVALLDARLEGEVIVVTADVGRKTYLTLDGTGVPRTTEIVGGPLEGAHAQYQVMETSNGHIAQIRIRPFSAEVLTGVSAFKAGRLAVVQ